MSDISVERKMDSEDEKKWYKTNLEKILQHTEKWIKVDDFDISPGCPPGENFVADVFRVVVYGRRLSLNGWTDIRKNFIIKRMPDSSSPRHKFYDCLRMFQNEIRAYEDILPMCQTYLDVKFKNEINELSFPRFYGQSQQFLLLQDLQTEGYQIVNRVKGFSMRECSAILQELSRFHAISFALKEHNRGFFCKAVNKLDETVFRPEYCNRLNPDFWENSVAMAIRSLSESKNPRLNKASDILKLSSGHVMKTLIDITKPVWSKFEVICHGDLWSNNILIRYCDSGYPVGVKFIDLQAMRYSSCVLDVMHILFTSSRPVIYELYFHLLLSEYYNSLVINLKTFETVPEFTFEEFMLEFKKKISFGVILACIMFTCVTRTSGPEPTNDIIENENPNESEFDKIYRSLSDEYHTRLHALFLALSESDLI